MARTFLINFSGGTVTPAGTHAANTAYTLTGATTNVYALSFGGAIIVDTINTYRLHLELATNLVAARRRTVNI